MSSNQNPNFEAFIDAFHDQSILFTEKEFQKLVGEFRPGVVAKEIAKSGSVRFLQMWIAIGFKVNPKMIKIATEHGNLAFLKECYENNSVKCDLDRIRMIAMVEKEKHDYTHIVEWLDEIESQP